jgi:uroporphyrinogen decarboxylase
MGVVVGFAAGEGPIVGKVTDEKLVKALGSAKGAWQVDALCETLRQVRAGLDAEKTLIGFCGAPWTVASYMIEGGSSDERLAARRAAAEAPGWFSSLVGRLVDESVAYLAAQVKAGAEAVQIFDSWAGDLPWDLQEEWVHRPLKALVSGFRKACPSTPVIVFARGAGAGHLDVIRTVKPNAVSLEPGVPLGWASEALVPEAAVQGNLDPVVLAGGGDQLDRSVGKIVEVLPKARHVFNLGHGIRPETNPAHLTRVIELVRAHDG